MSKPKPFLKKLIGIRGDKVVAEIDGSREGKQNYEIELPVSDFGSLPDLPELEEPEAQAKPDAKTKKKADGKK